MVAQNKAGDMFWSPAETHTVENDGKGDTHVYIVEVKDANDFSLTHVHRGCPHVAARDDAAAADDEIREQHGRQRPTRLSSIFS